MSRLLDLASEWLARSRRAPLSVTLRVKVTDLALKKWGVEDGLGIIDAFLQWFKLLEAHHERWRSIKFDYSYVAKNMTLSLRGMPQLEELDLSFPSTLSDAILAETLIDLSQSVFLKTLALNGNFLLSPNRGFVLKNLTSLTIIYSFLWRKTPCATECLALIECAPSLENLSVEFWCEEHPLLTAHRPPVIAHSVRSFHLKEQVGPGSETSYLCNSLSLPGLEEVKIEYEGNLSLDLSVMMQRSRNPEIMMFRLTDDAEILPNLALLPNLSSLVMWSCDCSRLVEHLTDATENLCPKVTSFVFIDCEFDMDLNFLVQMIHTRWTTHLASPSRSSSSSTPSTSLKFIFLDCDTHGAASSPLVELCVDEGLVIDIADGEEGTF